MKTSRWTAESSNQPVMSGRTPDAMPYRRQHDAQPDDELVRPDPLLHRARNLLAARIAGTNTVDRGARLDAVTITRVADFPFEVPDSGVVLKFEVCGFGVRTGDRRIVIDPWLAFDRSASEPDGSAAMGAHQRTS